MGRGPRCPPQTAYRWFRQGHLPVPAERVGGLILVGNLSGADPRPIDRTAVYARVSPADQKDDLDAQVARVTAWATSHLCARLYGRRSTAHRADMDAKVADLTHESVPWNPYAPMKHFNAEKPVIAPWWRESPKEAYSTGIADPCSVIKNCKDSKSAKCARRRAPGVYSDWSLQERPGSSVADDAGTLTEVPNPAPLRATLQQRRRPGQQLSRRTPGSNGHRAAKAKLTRLDRRAVHLRREAHHELTSQLAGTHSEVVIEDLDLAAMNKSMGRRSFRRSVSDAALGAIRSQLTYKMTWRGTTFTVADRWFALSKIHHGCGCRLIEPKKLARQLSCATTGELVDRYVNAAQNLRDWPDIASCGSVGATAPKPSSPTGSCGGLGSDVGVSGAGGGDVRPLQSQEAVPGEARTEPGNRRGTLRRCTA